MTELAADPPGGVLDLYAQPARRGPTHDVMRREQADQGQCQSAAAAKVRRAIAWSLHSGIRRSKRLGDGKMTADDTEPRPLWQGHFPRLLARFAATCGLNAVVCKDFKTRWLASNCRSEIDYPRAPHCPPNSQIQRRVAV